MTDEPMYLISESELKKVTHFNWMEVWDRVRARGPVQQAPIGDCHYCDRCIEAERRRAREGVLDELAQMYANVPEQFLEGTYRLHSEWKEKIESLRHGQKQERDPE